MGQHAQLEALAAGLLESQEETGCWHPHHCFQLKKKLPISTVEDRPRPLPAVLLATTMPASHSARLGRLAAHLRVHEAPKRVRPQRCGGMIGPHVVILGAATADAGERPTPPKEGCFKPRVFAKRAPLFSSAFAALLTEGREGRGIGTMAISACPACHGKLRARVSEVVVGGYRTEGGGALHRDTPSCLPGRLPSAALRASKLGEYLEVPVIEDSEADKVHSRVGEGKTPKMARAEHTATRSL